MGRNIIICSDGTGNTFDQSISNVTRLIELLDLHNHQTQIVVYSQGVGTNAERLQAIENFRLKISDQSGLEIMSAPKDFCIDIKGVITRISGLLIGTGFEHNLKELYRILSQLYESPEDKIYLFGFSRGAFTVRALAGLVYRCGLPIKNVENFETCFKEAYALYEPMKRDQPKIAEFRKKYATRDCTFHFLGIWDTVKSYGGFWPIVLPHLRHNPQVRTVRHALALHERRSWFNATTWGRLVLDERGAEKRLTPDERAAIQQQDIEEVWFRGCHSDVGGGDEGKPITKIALRWMLGEAVAAGLKLNTKGNETLQTNVPSDNKPEIHESLKCLWWLSEFIPRWEIDNSGEYPKRKFKFGRTGKRHPFDLIRKDSATNQQIITLHDSVEHYVFKYFSTKNKNT